MCKTKYFICDPVSVKKKIANSSSKNKNKIDILFLLEEVAIFCYRKRFANKIFSFAHLYYITFFSTK